jgi:ferredoxin--NADP+ reductase
VYDILAIEDLAPVTKLYEIQAPVVARKARAGQFVIIRLTEEGERVPLTIADYDRERGTVTLVVQEVGKTTMQMTTMQVGEQLASLTGPLGVPSELDE